MRYVKSFLQGFFYSFIAIAALPILLVQSLIDL
ncbi:hypothetical protein SK3146_04441 [Paenibacillus konkukensis]|uniref:Uncharacterized protein n=1 Tax=Paenibacillus konkukensis TaxID=2020716 RepID=A0ABY4RSS4_9BACL|nr:hypothetical protein SK3146_04441 [Paenibacillus konkukensis]